VPLAFQFCENLLLTSGSNALYGAGSQRKTPNGVVNKSKCRRAKLYLCAGLETTTMLNKLRQELTGELFTDDATRILYATDASAYREMPLAVAIPANKQDIRTLIQFAVQNSTSLIPRTAGTSLAGQVVGNGIVVDVSKHFTQIIELNTKEQWVRVEPGVVRDELNLYLKPYGLFFGPETSTANRAMMGGMVGNNSCGSNSVVYGSTRDHLLEVKCLLSDGREAVFGALGLDDFHARCELPTLEGRVYQQVRNRRWSRF